MKKMKSALTKAKGLNGKTSGKAPKLNRTKYPRPGKLRMGAM